MGIQSINTSNQNHDFSASKVETPKKTENNSAITKLNTQIKQKETALKQLVRDAQAAAAEGPGGTSEKAQLLQNKIAMQQQQIALMQMQVRELTADKEPTNEKSSMTVNNRSRFDKFERSEERGETQPNNIYRIEEKDGTRKIVFNRHEDQQSANKISSILAKMAASED